MNGQPDSPRSAAYALLPFATAALAIAIFIADTVTRVDIAVSVLYVTVVLMSTRFCSPRSVVLVGLGCVGLTALSFFLSLPGGPYIEGVINTWVSVTAIGLTTFLALQSQSAEARLREQASLLDLTHDVVVTRTMDDVITYWNRGAEDLYGWHRADAVGKVAPDLLGTTGTVPLDQAKAELLRTGRFEGELVNKRHDGTPVHVTSRWSLQRDRQGRPSMIMVTSNDITEQKRAEAALRLSEERWRRLFETSAAGMALTRLDGVFTAVNPALQRMLGRAEEEIVGHSFLELNPEEERAPTAAALAKFRSGSLTERQVEKKYKKKDGSAVWLNITTTMVPATETTAPFLQVVYMDITGRVQAEAALRASEERWRTVFEAAAVGIATTDLEHRYVTANQTYQRMIGYTEAELKNLTPEDITHEDDLPATQKYLDGMFAGQHRSYRLEKRYRRKDGEVIWADVNPFFVPPTEATPAFSAAIVIDITDRKRAEAALRASEERWRLMFETSAAGMATARLDGVFTTANPALRRMLDRTEDEILGHTAMEITHEDERTETEDVVARFRSGLQQEYHVEKRYLKKDGSSVWLNITTTLVPATETDEPFLQAIYINITDRKRAEAALRASEERWRALLETAPVGIATLDFKRRNYLSANVCFQRMIGYTEDELRQLTVLDVTHEDDRAATQRRIDSGAIGVLQQKRYRHRDGGVVWADVTAFEVPATESTPAFLGAVIVDMTDRKDAEEALQQAQADLARLNRVMLLGEMTASIAHEINQPIAAVITNASAGIRWLGAQPPDMDEVRQVLGRIVRDGTRAGEVIGRIRALIKKVPPRRELLDVNNVIREVAVLTQTEMQRSGVRLQSRLADAMPLVLADRVQLQQVMINLIVNAIEAMAGASGLPRELAIVSGTDAANAVFVEVQDTGPGLDPDELDRLFQSFYTTKPDGIGMGLAISRSIVEAHGGRLAAAPNKPRGAVFFFTLPVG